MGIEKRVVKAKYGRKFWLSLVEKFRIDQSVYVVVLPDKKKDNNSLAMSLLLEFLGRKGTEKTIVLFCDEWELEQQIVKNISFMKCKEEEIDGLIQFYCLYEFTTNLVIASLEQPAGRLGLGMIGKKGLEKDEIFAGVVYGLTM